MSAIKEKLKVFIEDERLNLLEIISLIEKVEKAYTEGNYEQVLHLTDKATKDGEITGDTQMLFFFRAAALDYTGKSEEAIVIFDFLRKMFPANSFYNSSVNLTFESLVKKCAYNEADPELTIKKYNFLVEYKLPNLYMSESVCLAYLALGKNELALETSGALLELSPADVDYNRLYWKVAKIVGNPLLIKNLIVKLDGILKEMPMLLELAELREEIANSGKRNLKIIAH